ncbi:MAG: DUF5990 family protein [Actinomycetota bacterium]
MPPVAREPPDSERPRTRDHRPRPGRPWEDRDIDIRIVGVSLPGRRFSDGGPGGCVYDDVRIGVQRGRDVDQLAPGDAASVVLNLDLRPVEEREARGPYVHGRRGERFLYLVWVAGDDRIMFRRAKLMLNDIPESAWEEAQAPGRILEGTLALTDARGGPLCARVRPGVVSWRSIDAT